MVHVVPLRAASMTVNKPAMAEAPNPNDLVFGKPVNLQPTTQRSVIAVPFEAFITITREKEPEPTESKDCDQSEASTSDSPEVTEPVKKEMDSSRFRTKLLVRTIPFVRLLH